MKHRLAQNTYPDEGRTLTICSCGARLEAVDEPGDPQHDVLHFRLADALGLDESPTLLRLVHDQDSYATDRVVAFEEATVLAATRLLEELRREP